MRRSAKAIVAALGVLAAVFAVGCAWMYSAAAPIQTTTYLRAPGAQAPTLLILLPGRGDAMGAFAEHGFVDDVRAAGADVDVVAVDATFGYYAKETIVDRVWTDVIVPAQARGYRRIWLAGISMGGLGAVAIARQHEDALDQVILLAPYLGPDSLLEEITEAGGAARWKADDPRDPYQHLWKWLQRYAAPSAKPPELMLAFGSKDRLVAGQRLLAALLPPRDVLEVPGGHEWTTWRALWRQLWSSKLRQ